MLTIVGKTLTCTRLPEWKCSLNFGFGILIIAILTGKKMKKKLL